MIVDVLRVVLVFAANVLLNWLSGAVTGVSELVVGKFAQVAQVARVAQVAQVADLAEELPVKSTRLSRVQWKMSLDWSIKFCP